jgi:type IV pilus assembly protein PilY1
MLPSCLSLFHRAGFALLYRCLLGACAIALGLTSAPAAAGPLNLSQVPLFLTQGQAPLVLLTMARDHKLFYTAYNDYSDLNGDGILDVGYKPAIDYYGYFDSYKCYAYDSSNGRFTPAAKTDDKKCSAQWSGDFLNYVTMTRMDALRKVLYGGARSTDTAALTVLERSFVPQDSHSWGKEYFSIERDGYDIRQYTPLALPDTGRYHIFANTTLTSDTSPPLMRVLANTNYRVWEWLSIERPVAGSDCATGNNSRANCAVAGGTVWEKVPASYFSGLTQTTYDTTGYGNGSPGSQSTYDAFEATYATTSRRCGTRSISRIDGSGNPFSTAPCKTGSDNYLNVITGTINIPATGTYTFAVDGDDAVDVFIDGAKVADYYNGHGECNCQTHTGSITLTAGAHTIKFRHQDGIGGDTYRLYWQRTIPNSTMTDYAVRVEVCNQSIGLESNCETYGTANKPVGLLQRQGENNGMYFGLLTGSYAKNTQGGVLRKAISSINNEITVDGRFGSPSDTCMSGAACVNGIITTINRLKIAGFNYSDHAYACGWITTRQMNDGECNMWGNPIGEMVYEGLRYFAGKDAPTTAFAYSAGNTALADNALGLPQLTSWTNPYSTSADPTASPATFPSCSKPYTMLISDVYPSFDSDSVPGSAFNTFSGDLSGLNVSILGQTMWNKEMGNGAKNIFIGQAGDVADGAPTTKSASSFGNIRGLAPGEPTRQGSYYAAAAAYYGHITDLNPIGGSQKLNTYAIALAAPLPKLEIPVGANTVTIMPFAKSVGGANITLTAGSFQPTNQIVSFYIDTIRNVNGSPTDANINGGRPYYRFRINYEDVEQGADHDMDAIGLYEIKLNANGTISISISSDYAAGGITQHMGFAISGTTRDGAYLLVRDSDTASGSDFAYALDCRSATSNPADCVKGSGDLPLYKELSFTANGTGSGTLLKDPLWYAAKWGSFIDDNANSLPDSTEWDADVDGIPDNYFLVTNPLNLETQLTKAFAKIKNDSATAAATSTNSFSYQSDSTLYQARFSSDGWGGELNAYPINSDGTLGDAIWQAQYQLATTASASRAILTYDPDATVHGIPFQWGSMTQVDTTSLPTPYLRTALNKTYNDTADNLGSARVSFLRGDAVIDMRTRPYIKGTLRTNKLGDIVSSQPQYVATPNFGYPERTYATFRTMHESRAPMIYVGANDGMLHGFSAADGTEKIAYVPSEMYRKRNNQRLLSKLTASNYGQTTDPHSYYVDGTPSVGDVCTAACAAATDWKTILVGGLNGGGQGIYALNITNPDNFSETNAGSTVLWEFNDRQDADIGYTYSRPSIVRLCTARTETSGTVPKTCTAGRWVVIVGNGYNDTEADGHASATGHAVLFVLDALTGTVIRKISTMTGDTGTPNGLSTPAAVDVDNDEYVDYVYAGDLLGNLWKFDLTSDVPNNWDSAYKSGTNPAPLYTAKAADTALKITTAPDAMLHPDGGIQVVFGTGSYITTDDKNDTTQNRVYGIRDNGTIVPSADLTNLQQQAVNTNSATVGANDYRTVSKNALAASKQGWYLNLPDSGERIAYDPRILGSVLAFTSTVPTSDRCGYGGWSWDYYVDALTGARLEYSAFLGIPSLTYGAGDDAQRGYASARKSPVGITPPGTVITQGKGRGKDIICGSTGECDEYDVKLGQSLAGRVSWREILSD